MSDEDIIRALHDRVMKLMTQVIYLAERSSLLPGDEIDRLYEELVAMMETRTGIGGGNLSVLIGRECQSSPCGYCAYNILEDPVQDNCIFCHEPYERK